MKNFGTRLKSALSQCGKTQVALADHLNITPQAVQKWVGGTTPTNENVVKIATFLNVSPSWLLFGASNETQLSVIEVPESSINHTNGITHSPIDHAEVAVYLNSWFISRQLNPKRCIRVRVSGNSMQPLLFGGDLVLIHLDDVQIEDGGVYGVVVDGVFCIRRLASIVGVGIKVLPDNPAYEESTLNNELFKNRVQIVGRVCDKSGRGGL